MNISDHDKHGWILEQSPLVFSIGFRITSLLSCLIMLFLTMFQPSTAKESNNPASFIIDEFVQNSTPSCYAHDRNSAVDCLLPDLELPGYAVRLYEDMRSATVDSTVPLADSRECETLATSNTPSKTCNSIVYDSKSGLDFSDISLPIYQWSSKSSSPRLIVLALHGGCLDGRAYAPIGELFSERDITTVSLDMRGFGKWYHEDFGGEHDRTFRYDDSRKDIARILTRLKENYPDVKIVCLGESLGANMAMVVAGTHPELVDGVVLVSPYAGPRLFLYPQMMKTLIRFLRHPLSELDMSPYLQRRMADRREYAIAHINGPRSRDQQSAIELIRSWRLNVLGTKMIRKVPEEMPVLFVAGEFDRLCHPFKAYRLFSKIPSKSCRFVLLPRQGHLMVESEFLRDEVVEVIGQWLEERSRPSTQIVEKVPEIKSLRISSSETQKFKAGKN